MTAATLYMGWLRSTTIPFASSFTYLKSKNMSISCHTSNDLEHSIDRPCTWQWLMTTTQFRELHFEHLNGSSAIQEILHYGAQRFIAIRIKSHLWCLSWASSIHIQKTSFFEIIFTTGYGFIFQLAKNRRGYKTHTHSSGCDSMTNWRGMMLLVQ
jgi:hypothetical protein